MFARKVRGGEDFVENSWGLCDFKQKFAEYYSLK